MTKTIDALDNIVLYGGGKGVVDLARDLIKGELKLTWATFVMLDVIANSQNLKNELEMLESVKRNYDDFHKSKPSSSYGVYMHDVHATIPASGSAGVKISSFTDIYSGNF